MTIGRGDIEKYAGISANVATTWIRDGVLLPVPGPGRNKKFEDYEAIVARIISVPHAHLRPANSILAGIAGYVRELVSVGNKFGCKSALAGERKAKLERAAIIKNGKDTKLHEVADKWANELGVSDIPNPTMTMDEVRELENWVGLRKCIEGGKQGWMTIAATNDKGWYVGFTTRKPTQEDDLSFITVVKPSYPSTVFLVLDLLEIFSEASEN